MDGFILMIIVFISFLMFFIGFAVSQYTALQITHRNNNDSLITLTKEEYYTLVSSLEELEKLKEIDNENQN